tara:strand:+ start:437 stop:568 length:132 start_codon:yes stop_codon:yes gene_type:complete
MPFLPFIFEVIIPSSLNGIEYKILPFGDNIAEIPVFAALTEYL